RCARQLPHSRLDLGRAGRTVHAVHTELLVDARYRPRRYRLDPIAELADGVPDGVRTRPVSRSAERQNLRREVDGDVRDILETADGGLDLGCAGRTVHSAYLEAMLLDCWHGLLRRIL